MKADKIKKEEVLTWVREVLREYKDGASLAVEVKRYVARRTLTQNAFFHLLVGYIAHELGMDAALVKEGIKQKYGHCMVVFGRLVPIPSRLCDKLDQMSALIEGCFREAGDQGLDMREWIRRWKQIRKERGNEILR